MLKIRITTFQFSPVSKGEVNLEARDPEEAHEMIINYFSSIHDIYNTDLVKKYESSAKRADLKGCPVVVYSHPASGVLVRHFVDITEIKKVFIYGTITSLGERKDEDH